MPPPTPTTTPPLLEQNPPAHAYAAGSVPVAQHSNDGAAPRGSDAGHGGEHAREIDLPPMSTGVVLLLGLVLLGLFAALFVVGWLPHHRRLGQIEADAAKKQESKPIVDVATPKREQRAPALELPGATRAFQSTAVYPRAAGYLRKLHVDIGDHVTEGELLAEIESPELNAQLNAAQATAEQAQANATKTKSDLDLAQATFTRYQGFASTGGVTQQQLEEKQSAVEQAKSVAAAADATVRVDQAEVQRLTALTGFQKVYAPFAGTITSRAYDVGALLSATTGGSGGAPLFQIDQTQMLRVFVDVPQGYADRVKVGESASFEIRGAQNHTFQGTIARTAGALDEQTRTLRVEADFPNSDGSLLPGMYGQVRYELKQDQPPLVIPSSALVFSADGTRVAIVQDDNKVKFQPIVIGRDLGTQLEIASGLTGNERVISNPGERLADGIEVAVAQHAAPAAPQGQPPAQPSQPPQATADNRGGADAAVHANDLVVTPARPMITQPTTAAAVREAAAR